MSQLASGGLCIRSGSSLVMTGIREDCQIAVHRQPMAQFAKAEIAPLCPLARAKFDWPTSNCWP